jgi:uncharacterized protein
MFQLLEDDQSMLLSIAREAVRSHLSDTTPLFPESFTQPLAQQRAVFVSIHRHVDNRKELRGCIGNLYPSAPLYQSTAECAISAAMADPRFEPLTLTDLKEVEFEISVLSLMERVNGHADIEVGKHGVYVSRNQSRALLLPQVAKDFGWDSERFLNETCQKAGLGADEWKKGATIHRFTAQVFSEQKTRVS